MTSYETDEREISKLPNKPIQIFQRCDKCGISKKFTFTRTYPFVVGYKTLCRDCHEKIKRIISIFFNEEA